MSENENAKVKVPEKSNFTRRCSLLSRYLKEKGSFGNIDLTLVRKPDSDLGLPRQSDPPERQIGMQKANSEIKAVDFTQRVSKGEPSTSSGGKAKDTNLRSKLLKRNMLLFVIGGAGKGNPVNPGFQWFCSENGFWFFSESELRSSQLTIFFGGKVLVYNEFPSDKAKEIIEVAKQAKPLTNEINIQTQINVQINNKSNMTLPDLNEATDYADMNHEHHTTQEQQQQQNQLVERIARRASLHRFFAKRKDRAVARAPYQVNQNAGQHRYPPKPETIAGQPLEPGQSSQRPDNVVAHPKSEGDKDMTMQVEEEGQCSKDLELRL